MEEVEGTCRFCAKSFTKRLSPAKVARNKMPIDFCSDLACVAKARTEYRFGKGKRAYRTMITIKGHPLADKQGRLFTYRAILYEALGPGSHPCHWCGRLVEWTPQGKGRGCFKGVLAVDHLDGDMHNNIRRNLVPSCNDCNTLRGYIRGWETRTGRPIADLQPSIHTVTLTEPT